MDGLSAATSVVAVIQISSQVFDLCRTYYLNVKDARKDIQRLRNEITALQDVLANLADLADDPNSASSRTLALMTKEDGPLLQCQSELIALAARLEPGRKGRMREFGMRALKWPFTSKEVDGILNAIGRHKSSFSLALETDQTTLSLSIARAVLNIEQKMESQKLDDDRGEIIHWLSTSDPSTNHHAACQKCQPGTGRWLLEKSEFKEWPGSGKTILSSIVIEDLRSGCNIRPGPALAYFYFDFNSATKQELAKCLGSIVAQLCSHLNSVPDHIRNFYERCSHGKHRSSLAELKEMIYRASERLDDVFFVFDALDECPRNGEKALLLATISDILTTNDNVHIFATSRCEPDIDEALTPLLSFPAIPLRGTELDFDIKSDISCQLATDSSLKKWSREIKAEIESSLTVGANGMFRWVDCQLDALKKCLKASFIRNVLQHLPKTLDETYSRVFSTVEEVYREDAKNALTWLAFSEDPLQLSELAEATIIRPCSDIPFDPNERFPDARNVLEILSSIVTVNCLEDTLEYIPAINRDWKTPPDGTNTSKVGIAAVTLAHYTVKEYLISERIKKSSEKYFSAPVASSIKFIAEGCLHDMLHWANSSPKPLSTIDLHSFPLLHYATCYWHVHIRALPYDDQKALNPLVLKLLLSQRSQVFWQQLWNPYGTHTAYTDPHLEPEIVAPEDVLKFSVDMGLASLTQELIDRGRDPKAKDQYSERHCTEQPETKTQKWRCCYRETGLSLMLSTIFDQTPLHFAADSEDEDMVDMLQDWGADINVRNEDGGDSFTLRGC